MKENIIKRLTAIAATCVFLAVPLGTAMAQEAVADDAQGANVEEVYTEGRQVRTLTNLPTSWDLKELYENDAAFEADMKRLEELIPQINPMRGTLNSVEGLLNYMESPVMLEINAILNRAYMYTGFLGSLNATDPWALQAGARLQEVSQKVSIALAFVDAEIMQMPLEKRQELFSDQRLAPYAYYLRDYTDPNFVVLSEESQTIMTLMDSAINSGSTHDVFDYVELPRPTFTYPDGSEGTLSDATFTRIMQNSDYDHEFRKQIYALRNAMRAPYAHTYASLLEGAMRANWAQAQIKHYDSTLKAALHNSDVHPEIYDRIIEFAHSILPKVYAYYEAKKALLGLDEIMICDLSLPVTAYNPEQITYEDAVNTGRAGISVWGDEYLAVFDKIIQSPHIDVYPSETKQTGAYENLSGNETTPFVMYNFDDTQTYISTIVHEMGHAVYSQFSAENQNEYNNQPGIFTQEVASTANEIMFHNYMIKNAGTTDEKLYWLDHEINLFLSTLARQCMYSEFEDYCYKTIEGGGSLDATAMANKWIELEKLYYGDVMTILDDSGIDWARVPHFYYNYYVYKYATSITYAAALCKQVETNGQETIDAYLEFLKAGNSASPAELLKIAGVDPLSDDAYEMAGELIDNLIDEFLEAANAAAASAD